MVLCKLGLLAVDTNMHSSRGRVHCRTVKAYRVGSKGTHSLTTPHWGPGNTNWSLNIGTSFCRLSLTGWKTIQIPRVVVVV